MRVSRLLGSALLALVASASALAPVEAAPPERFNDCFLSDPLEVCIQSSFFVNRRETPTGEVFIVNSRHRETLSFADTGEVLSAYSLRSHSNTVVKAGEEQVFIVNSRVRSDDGIVCRYSISFAFVNGVLRHSTQRSCA